MLFPPSVFRTDVIQISKATKIHEKIFCALNFCNYLVLMNIFMQLCIFFASVIHFLFCQKCVSLCLLELDSGKKQDPFNLYHDLELQE